MCSFQRTNRITPEKSDLVGVTGLEPVTLRLSSACSNQLSYTPQLVPNWLVELRRVELPTACLQSRCSTTELQPHKLFRGDGVSGVTPFERSNSFKTELCDKEALNRK